MQGLCHSPCVPRVADWVGCLQAMENSTKNSADMLERLTLMYNRTRQAKVTTELNEIISGALSLEDAG
jgi:ATP synthase F1 gamma subunit